LKSSKLSLEELAYLSAREQSPVWVEFHASEVAKQQGAKNTDFLSKEQQQAIEEECRKLDAFCNLLCNSKLSHAEAEKQVYGTKNKFYAECRKARKAWERERARRLRQVELQKQRSLERERKEEEKLRQAQARTSQPKAFDLEVNLHLEKGLSKKQREELLANDFKRLKISPFGNSGAAFYWVRTNWHESKEHAFFCYLIASELKKYVGEIRLDSFDSPDVEFGVKTYKCCFEVETGEVLKRNADYVKQKFKQLDKDYSKVFVFVTNKKLKYKYSKYGEVVTRGTLKKTLAKLFRDKDAKPKQKA